MRLKGRQGSHCKGPYWHPKELMATGRFLTRADVTGVIPQDYSLAAGWRSDCPYGPVSVLVAIRATSVGQKCPLSSLQVVRSQSLPSSNNEL